MTLKARDIVGGDILEQPEEVRCHACPSVLAAPTLVHACTV